MKRKLPKATHSLSRVRRGKSGSAPNPFPIVGIGASAGGVEAFTRLIENLPPDSGMAFVLIPHLAPTRKSELAHVLSRGSQIPITEAKHRQVVEPDHAYIIPPGKQMVFQ